MQKHLAVNFWHYMAKPCLYINRCHLENIEQRQQKPSPKNNRWGLVREI